MSVSPEVKSIVRVELLTSRPKTYREALRIVDHVLSTHGVQHTDLFDPRRACSRFCKSTVTAL